MFGRMVRGSLRANFFWREAHAVDPPALLVPTNLRGKNEVPIKCDRLFLWYRVGPRLWLTQA